MSCRVRRLMAAMVCLLLTCPAANFAADTYTFRMVQYPGAIDTLVYGVNNNGVVVGEYGDIDFSNPVVSGQHGFRFDGTTYETIDVPGSLATSVLGINDEGVVVGEYLDPSGATLGFVYNGMEYRTIVTPFGTHASAAAINNKGQIVGSFSDDDFVQDAHGFVLMEGVFQMVNYPRAKSTFLLDVNESGDAVGTYVTADAAGGFLKNGFARIAYPGGLDFLTSDARALNNAEEVVGNYTLLAGIDEERFVALVENHAFLRQADGVTYTEIDFPANRCTFEVSLLDPKPPAACVRAVRNLNDEGIYVGYTDDNNGIIRGFIATPSGGGLVGDFDQDGALTDADIDLLTAAVFAGNADAVFDLNADQHLDLEDRRIWVEDLKQTYYGDANLDGEFASSDIIDVFVAGEYEDATEDNSGWSEGDWNGDLDCGTTDIIVAFQAGGYEQGPRLALQIPEPHALTPVMEVVVLLLWCRRHVRGIG